MEQAKTPMVIKRKNTALILTSILEFVIACIFCISQGIKSSFVWVFVMVAILTALSSFAELDENISLKENKIEIYKKKNIQKSIDYCDIISILIENGEKFKKKNRDFVVIEFNKVNPNSKSKYLETEVYLIDTMYYSSKDLRSIKDVILMKNSYVKTNEKLKEYFNNPKNDNESKV